MRDHDARQSVIVEPGLRSVLRFRVSNPRPARKLARRAAPPRDGWPARAPARPVAARRQRGPTPLARRILPGPRARAGAQSPRPIRISSALCRTKAKIRRHVAGKKKWPLCDHADAAPKLARRQLAIVLPVDVHRAAGRFVQTIQKRNRELLPDPLAPTIPNRSSAATSNEMSLRMVFAPTCRPSFSAAADRGRNSFLTGSAHEVRCP